MAGPLTLVLLVAAGESADATTRRIADATHDALGPESRVLVRESQGAPDDEQALAAESSSRANAVIELRWAAPRRRRVTVRVHIASRGLWVERLIAFRPPDADDERARTLGFAIASILPETPPPAESPAADDAQFAARENDGTGERPAPRSAPRGTTPAPATSSAASTTPAVSPRVPNAPPGSNAPSGPVGAPAANPSTPAPISDHPASVPVQAGALAGVVASADTRASARPARITVEFVVVDAAGDDGGAQEIGGAGAFDWFLVQSVSIRMAITVRTATLDAAQGNLVKVLGAAGVALHPWRTSAAHPFGGSVRVDYLALYETLTHFPMPDRTPPTMDGRLSGIDAVADARWRFARDVDALVGAGLEAFPPTFVSEGGQRVTTLPPLRALVEAGLQLRF